MKKLVLLGLLGFCLTTQAQQTPVMQTLTGETAITCPQDNTLTLQGSEVGFNYYLRNEADDAIVAGPIAGTGAPLNFQTGEVFETNNYYVSAYNPSYALDFDGNDDTVSISHGDQLNFSTGLTIEGWIYPEGLTTSDGFQDIYRKENLGDGRILLGFQQIGTLETGAQRKLTFGVHTDVDGYIELDVDINRTHYENQWVHILAYFDDATDTMKLYTNGEEIGSYAVNGTIITPPQPTSAYIGSLANNSEFFNGKMASLRIWNKALTSQAEIDAAMANNFNGDEPGLVAYYAFDEGEGNTLNDNALDDQSLPYNNHGTIDGPTWTEVIIGNEVQYTASNSQTITYDGVTDIRYVDHTAQGNNDGTSWADAFTTITPAIDFINNKCSSTTGNDEIRMAQGNYHEGAPIVINNVLKMKGGYPNGGGEQDIENNPTSIDGNHSHRVIDASSLYTSTLNNSDRALYIEGLTIQNGSMNNFNNEVKGVAISAGNLSLNKSAVINTSANTTVPETNGFITGGGIYGYNVTLVDSHVSDLDLNVLAVFGGGIYGHNVTTLIDSHVSNINANSDFLEGAGIQGVHITLSDSYVSNITGIVGSGWLYGGAILAISSSMNNSHVSNNHFTSFSEIHWPKGGGINTRLLQMDNSQVNNNSVTSTNIFVQGGGIYMSFGNSNLDTAISIKNSQVSHNLISCINPSISKYAGGGGIWIDGRQSGAMSLGNLEFKDGVYIINSQINHNTIGCEGGLPENGSGIYANNFKYMFIVNSEINHNTITEGGVGGGIAIKYYFLTHDTPRMKLNMVNSSINNNTILGYGRGAGLYDNAYLEAAYVNSQIMNNSIITNGDTAGGAGIFPSNGSLINSTVWGNKSSVDGGITFQGSEVRPELFSINSFVKGLDLSASNGIDDGAGLLDPMFVDAENGDFRLQPGSPLIDAGDFNLLPADDFDLDGDNDIIENIPYDLAGYAREFGGNVDIGPYEYSDLIFKDGFD